MDLVGPARPIADETNVQQIFVSRVIHIAAVTEVSVRDLRNHGDEVIDRVARGKRITITRSGKPVAELRRLGQSSLSAQSLIDRWRHVPALDPATLRADLDDTFDSSM